MTPAERIRQTSRALAECAYMGDGVDAMTKAIAEALTAERKLAFEEAARCVPTNWCHALLTGPDGLDRTRSGKWHCQDIEKLLRGVQDSIRTLAQDPTDAT